MNNMKDIYYTLIYKQNCKTCFRSFISFETLKLYIEKCLPNHNVSNLKPVDKDLTIFYVEQDRSE